jgi:hypothetical protein
MKQSRRQFLSRGLPASLSLMTFPWVATRTLGENRRLPFDVHSLFESEDPAVLRLAEDVLAQCVLAKIKPPEGTLTRRWLNSGTGDAPFYGQWIWDTMFVVDFLAMLPDTKALIRDVFQNYWRGDVWPAPNYQVATAFARHGYADIAAMIADKTVANALKNGISEHYHAVTGKPLGVPYIGMCCTIVTMLLDKLCRQFQLRLRRA